MRCVIESFTQYAPPFQNRIENLSFGKGGSPEPPGAIEVNRPYLPIRINMPAASARIPVTITGIPT